MGTLAAIETREKEKLVSMSFLRRTTTSLTASIRQITASKPVKEAAIRASTVGCMSKVLNFVADKKVGPQKNVAKSIISHMATIRTVNPQSMLPSTSQTSLNLAPNAKCVLMSNTPRVDKLFASFDLSSMSISFVGMMGEFAVWALLDLSTGEMMYLIDDNF